MKTILYQITASYKIPSNVDPISKTQQLQPEHSSDPQILYKNQIKFALALSEITEWVWVEKSKMIEMVERI